jgi:dihydroflavonol-4-reductase
VLTSSFAAIGYGHAQEKLYTEEDWTDPEGRGVTAYAKSKTLAERAAWDFIEREGGGLELSVVNPVGIFGPALGSDFSTSIRIIQMLLSRAMPALPRIMSGAVDVRDVASLHLLAMTKREAKGERFLAVSGDFIALKEVAGILKTRLGAAAERTPTGEFPDWLLRGLAPFVPSVGLVVSELGKKRNASGEKARRLLGWQPRSAEDAVVASAESLIRLGAVVQAPKRGGKKAA